MDAPKRVKRNLGETKYMVTGGVLLAAVSLDALASQRRRAAGRA